jgi:CCR4-NOT transcription complex subunit 7/8
MFAEDSIELLKTSGIDFQKFDELGIDVHYFGELMMMSGLVLNEDVKWVSFHSSYDFGYLLKTLTCRELPLDEPGFMDLLHTYFPCIYDVKVPFFSILSCILRISMLVFFQMLSISLKSTLNRYCYLQH